MHAYVRSWPPLVLAFVLAASLVSAELRLSPLVSGGMVLQRDQVNRIRGWDEPGRVVRVEFAGNTAEGEADGEGLWVVELPTGPANGSAATMRISGSSMREVTDVLVGEVWVASGQSNMQWTVRNSLDYELVTAAGRHPAIRLITVPRMGTQELQTTFEGGWAECTPETLAEFSAVAYHFGEMLHRIVDVPIGLIHCSWGGSAAEAWVRREVIEQDGRFEREMQRWREIEATFDFEREQANYRDRLAAWETGAAQARAEGRPVPSRPGAPRDQLAGQHRPGNLFAGMINPILGYGIRGVIWYQGETNASRAAEYRDLFPLLIEHWREEWGQGEFPFYWVQLADFRAEKDQPSESEWAELREAQTLTMQRAPNTGQAVIIDLGEANDIHPLNKRDVGYRLARWALAKDYGIEIHHRSPEFREMEVRGERAVLKFDFAGGGLRTLDVNEVRGFAVRGKDGEFVWANAAIAAADTIEVWSDEVSEPAAVRYAWADNPVCNVFSREGLPLTPFRTDAP
jgi:sialate O-acetylesterase